MHDKYQRHLLLGSQLTGEKETLVISKFLNQRILLTGDEGRLETEVGRLMFFTSANLIARFCPKIDISISGKIKEEIIPFLQSIDGSSDADFRLVNNVKEDDYAAILSIGESIIHFDRTLIIDGFGWLALLSIGKAHFHPSPEKNTNPLGPLMAVAFGVSEVFKHLLKPKSDRAVFLGNTSFSLYDYKFGSNNTGPIIPEGINLPPTLLAGVGAVGNAFLLALSSIHYIKGTIIVVDNQCLDDPTNLNRYSLAFEGDIGLIPPLPKVALARRLFAGTEVQIIPLAEELSVSLKRIYQKEIPRPIVVLSAVDNYEPREQMQKLWPDILMEGATDMTMAVVSRHEYEKGLACLLCIHPKPKYAKKECYENTMAKLSGLSEKCIAQSEKYGSTQVTQDDVCQAPIGKREYLARHVGHSVCSVLSELESLAMNPSQSAPVSPSVSFVSMSSGIMLATEYIKYAIKQESPIETIFYLDLMFPEQALLQPVEKTDACYCSQRKEEIQAFRELVRT
jgi:hypothetical protein